MLFLSCKFLVLSLSGHQQYFHHPCSSVQFRFSCFLDCSIRIETETYLKTPMRGISKIPQAVSHFSPSDHTGGFAVSLHILIFTIIDS